MADHPGWLPIHAVLAEELMRLTPGAGPVDGITEDVRESTRLLLDQVIGLKALNVAGKALWDMGRAAGQSSESVVPDS